LFSVLQIIKKIGNTFQIQTLLGNIVNVYVSTHGLAVHVKTSSGSTGDVTGLCTDTTSFGQEETVSVEADTTSGGVEEESSSIRTTFDLFTLRILLNR